MLAAKTALAIRVDALGEIEGPTIAMENRAKVEARVRQLEGGSTKVDNSLSGKVTAYDSASARAAAPPKYSDSGEITGKKRVRDSEDSSDEGEKKKAKKEKKEKKEEEGKEGKEGKEGEKVAHFYSTTIYHL